MASNTFEVNYDAGRKMETFRYKDLFHDVHWFYMRLPRNDLFFPHNVYFAVSQRAKVVNTSFKKLIEIFDRHREKESKAVYSPRGRLELIVPDSNRYKFIVEELIFHIKGVLDSLVQIAYIYTSFTDFTNTQKIEIDSIGELLKTKNKTSETYKIIFGDEQNFDSDKTGFLPLINDLFNSFKHCMLHLESHRLMGVDIPTILSYYAKNNSFESTVYFHNHNAFHIIMGFQDNVDRINSNLQKVKINYSQQ